MATPELEKIAREAARLSADEKLQLAARLIEAARQEPATTASAARWRDLRGQIPAPALGEEAQAWVTRTRQEGAARERR